MSDGSDPAGDVRLRSVGQIMAWVGLGAVVLGLDQLTKWLVVESLRLGERVDVLPIFSLVHWRNTGAAFSLFSDAGGRWFFVALAVGISVFLIYELRRLPLGNRLMGWAYGLILGGALGNGTDRLLSGYVVDFALAHYEDWYFPAFNVADSALTIGAMLWIFSMFLEYRSARGRHGGNDRATE